MNSELYDKTYKLPSNILKHINGVLMSNPKSDGVKRAKFILKNGSLTYQSMKRIKNFFDNFDMNNSDKIQYELAGGGLMKYFIDNALEQDRGDINRSKEIKQDVNIDVNLGYKPQQTPRLNEGDFDDSLTKNALAIIVNGDYQILLLKRVGTSEWQPDKWSLVGGGVEEGEKPVDACKREIKEETGLNIDSFSEKYVIQRNSDSVEHVFVCKYDGDMYGINLDLNENTQYGWFLPAEMKYLDRVPNLMDYVNLAFKKY